MDGYEHVRDEEEGIKAVAWVVACLEAYVGREEVDDRGKGWVKGETG